MGVSYRTAHRMFKRGEIQGAYQLESGTIIVPDQSNCVENTRKYVVYARVSSSQCKSDLESQSKRVIDFCAASGIIVSDVVSEVGSGLNDRRKKLQKILSEDVNIVVEHKDRLTRFGFEYLKTLLNKQGREIIVINEVTEDKQDLMQDLISVITSFTARYYGQRRKNRKTEKIIEMLQETDK